MLCYSFVHFLFHFHLVGLNDLLLSFRADRLNKLLQLQ